MFLRQDLDEEKLKTEEFMDLLEDGILQFARALTPERREYIANLLKNGLTDEEVDHLGKKKLLSLLNELNDAEVIILHYYSLETDELKETMRKRYPFLPRKSSTEDKRWKSEDPTVLHHSVGLPVEVKRSP